MWSARYDECVPYKEGDTIVDMEKATVSFRQNDTSVGKAMALKYGGVGVGDEEYLFAFGGYLVGDAASIVECW